MSIQIDIIADKKEPKYTLVIASVILLYFIGLLFLILNHNVLGFCFMILSFLGLQIFRFYNGRIKIGVLVIGTDKIEILSTNDNALFFGLENISSITILKSKAFDEFSFFLAWGNGTDNYLQLVLSDNRCLNLRLFFKTNKQLINTLYLLKKLRNQNVNVNIKNCNSKNMILFRNHIIRNLEDIKLTDI
jgi:hypothetical protein